MIHALDDLLTDLGACPLAHEWAKGKTLAVAWRTCKRGDWMLWLAAHLGVDRKLLVRAAVECVRPALKCVPKGEGRPAKALAVALAWCDGKAKLEEVRVAAYAASASASAYAASRAAAYASRAYASRAASRATAASYAASYAAAAYAASRAASYASIASYAAAARASLAVSAKTTRSIMPYAAVKLAAEGFYSGRGA